MNKLFMMVGLQGSGKSYYAENLAKEYNARIFSSDQYRSTFGDGEEDQSINGEIFTRLHKDIKNELLNGNSVIYDATNLISKKRRAFLYDLKKVNCEKICVLVLRKYENCLKANAERERKVPEYSIERYYKSFQVPYIEEGWNDIKLVYTDNDEGTIDFTLDMIEAMLYDQNNKHHSLTLGEHLTKARDYIVENYNHNDKHFNELYWAAYYHDIRKPFCRTETNRKGEVDDNSHYYGHDSAGGYDVLFCNLKDVDKLLISFLICNHMRPLNWINSQKSKDRDRSNWGKEKFNLIRIINRADIAAH